MSVSLLVRVNCRNVAPATSKGETWISRFRTQLNSVSIYVR